MCLCRILPRSTAGERLFEQIVDDTRIGLALHGLHRLADEETEKLFLASAILFELTGIIQKDLTYNGLDRGSVGCLFQAFFLDDLGSSIASFQHDFKYLLGNAARNRAIGDEAEQFGGVRGRDRRIRNVAAHAVERAEQLARHPVRRGGWLGARVEPNLQQRIEPARRLDLGGQAFGVVVRQAVLADEPGAATSQSSFDDYL